MYFRGIWNETTHIQTVDGKDCCLKSLLWDLLCKKKKKLIRALLTSFKWYFEVYLHELIAREIISIMEMNWKWTDYYID